MPVLQHQLPGFNRLQTHEAEVTPRNLCGAHNFIPNVAWTFGYGHAIGDTVDRGDLQSTDRARRAQTPPLPSTRKFKTPAIGVGFKLAFVINDRFNH